MCAFMLRAISEDGNRYSFTILNVVAAKDMLLSLITAVEEASFTVEGIVSDLGPVYRRFWKKLGISDGNPSIQPPCGNGKRLYCFADVPSLLNLVRNHVLDDGVTLPDGYVVSKQLFEAILSNKTPQN